MVQPGDVLFLKAAAGPVVGVAVIGTVTEFGPIDRTAMTQLLSAQATDLALDREWADRKREARYATLLHLTLVRRISKIRIEKRDRRTWVALTPQP